MLFSMHNKPRRARNIITDYDKVRLKLALIDANKGIADNLKQIFKAFNDFSKQYNNKTKKIMDDFIKAMNEIEKKQRSSRFPPSYPKGQTRE